MAEVSFALLCPSWALADFPSDCGINPTLPEFDCSRRWFFEPLFWLHMLRAQPILGDCFLSQPFQCPSFGCAGCMSDSTSKKNPFQVPFNESLPMHIAQVLGIIALRAGTSSGVYSEDNPLRIEERFLARYSSGQLSSKIPFQVPFNESRPMHIAQVLGIIALRAGTSSGVYSEDNPLRIEERFLARYSSGQLSL